MPPEEPNDDTISASEPEAFDTDEPQLDEPELDGVEPELDEGEGDPDGAGRPAPPTRGFGVALTLFGAAAIVWAGVAVMKFSKGPAGQLPGPEMSLGDETPPESEATLKPPPTAEPEPPAPAPAPEPEPEPEHVIPDGTYADGLTPPATVAYTIKRGGNIRTVANLHKIYHHEIEAMNPGVPLDRELPAGTAVTVYRHDPEASSESVGLATHGSLVNGVPMMEGPGRSIKATRWRTFGTEETVVLLDRTFKAWSDYPGNTLPILVGDLSAREGGKLSPHSSHQSGRDIDISYPQLPSKEEYNWREMTERNLDRAGTWHLLKLLADTNAVEVVIMDSKIQRLLHEYAVEHQVVPARELPRWLEYPRGPGSSRALVQHYQGHTDHMHVRFACPKGDTRCQTRRGGN